MPCALRISVALVALLLAFGPSAAASDPPEVALGDLVWGDVASGTVVVTTGHLSHVDGEALMTPNLPSAMAPIVVDVSRLHAADRARIEGQCAAVRTTSGGCQARIRAEVQRNAGRPGLAADRIEFLPQSR